VQAGPKRRPSPVMGDQSLKMVTCRRRFIARHAVMTCTCWELRAAIPANYSPLNAPTAETLKLWALKQPNRPPQLAASFITLSFLASAITGGR
jgi:hypothetical protein